MIGALNHRPTDHVGQPSSAVRRSKAPHTFPPARAKVANSDKPEKRRPEAVNFYGAELGQEDSNAIPVPQITPGKQHSKYYEYEEAWRLLKPPQEDPPGHCLETVIDESHKII